MASSFTTAGAETMSECIDKKYQALQNRHGIAVAVVDYDKTQFLFYGQAHKDQIFEIGSLTKTFTATLLAEEVIHRKIKLTDPIPAEYQKPGNQITYKHLTTHTSGIVSGNFPGYMGSNPESPYEGLSVSLFKELYRSTPLASPVGTKWNYSNIGTGVLGLVLSENNETNYSEMVKNRIFKVLGMTESYFEVPDSKLPNFPEGNVNGESWSHWDLFNTGINPAGGIRSTISDMAIFARANLVPFRTSLGSPIELAQEPLYGITDSMWIGMNWLIEPKKNLIWHNGSTMGFESILAISTKYSIAVVALTDTGIFTADSGGNVSQDNTLQDVVFGCMN